MTKIDWLKYYRDIDNINYNKGYIIEEDENGKPNEEQEKAYVQGGGFGLTIQMMQAFKKRTKYLSERHIVNYIKSELEQKLGMIDTSNKLSRALHFSSASDYQDFLTQYLAELEGANTSIDNQEEQVKAEEPIENPHHNYFTDFGWQLFERLELAFPNTNGFEYSFIYRAMKRDGYIKDLVGPTPFLEWLCIERPKSHVDKIRAYKDSRPVKKEPIYEREIEVLETERQNSIKKGR